MFDEPTAGMSLDEAPEVLDLIAAIKAEPGTHRAAGRAQDGRGPRLADRIIVLHNGALVADGPPAEVMASELVREVYLGKALADV